MTRDQLRQWIAENRFVDALPPLQRAVDGYAQAHPQLPSLRGFSDAVLQRQGQFNGIQQNKILGILESNEEQALLDDLRRGLLLLLDQLPADFWNYWQQHQAQQQSEREQLQARLQQLQQDAAFEFDIFLSYSTKDRSEAHPVWEQLRGYGLRVFLSDEALKYKVGTSFSDKIQWALAHSRHYVLLATPHALQSDFVHTEGTTFFDQFYIKNKENRRFIILKGQGFNAEQLPIFWRSLQFADTVDQIARGVAPDLDTDGQLWNEVAEKDEVPSYHRYLKRFPNGRFAAQAQQAIQRIEKQALAKLEEIKRHEHSIAKTLQREEKADNPRRAPFYFLLVLGAGVLGFLIWYFSGGNAPNTPEKPDPERLACDAALQRRSVEACNDYLQQYPKGACAERIKLLADTLLGNVEVDADGLAWQSAQKAHSIAAYETYLDEYPDGKYAADAMRSIQILEEIDSKAWAAAETANTPEAYEIYLNNHPQGDFADKARAKLGLPPVDAAKRKTH